MSILNDPRVTTIDGGYRVDNPVAGPIRVYQHPHGMWRAFFDTATPNNLRPSTGLYGSFSSDVAETVAYALRTEEVTA